MLKKSIQILTSTRRIPSEVIRDADETVSFVGIGSADGPPASLFRLVLSEVYECKSSNTKRWSKNNICVYATNETWKSARPRRVFNGVSESNS